MAAPKKTSLKQKIEEQEASIALYVSENIKLRQALDEIRAKINMQAAEILIFVDQVKLEKKQSEDAILGLETEINAVWGFVQDLKDTMGEDCVIRSLLEKHSLDEENTPSGYQN